MGKSVLLKILLVAGNMLLMGTLMSSFEIGEMIHTHTHTHTRTHTHTHIHIDFELLEM